MKIRLGTRASLLARTQSGWVADQLRESTTGLEIEEVLIETGGDQDQETALRGGQVNSRIEDDAQEIVEVR